MANVTYIIVNCKFRYDFLKLLMFGHKIRYMMEPQMADVYTVPVDHYSNGMDLCKPATVQHGMLMTM